MSPDSKNSEMINDKNHNTQSSVVFYEYPVEHDSGGKFGHIQLNSIKNYNALSVEMIDLIFDQLQAWENDQDLKWIWFDSALEKAFSAGGDVLAIYQQGKGNSKTTPELAKAFFAKEYRNNLYIHQYPKPIIFWASGLVLGGGLGLMANGAFRIGTETSQFAWPEIKIGLFPDVGAGYYLSKIPTPLSNLIGMLGVTVNVNELRDAGLIDCQIASDKKQELFDLMKQTDGSLKQLRRVARRLQNETLHLMPLSRFDEDAKVVVAGRKPREIANYLKGYEGDNPLLLQARENLLYGSAISAQLFVEQRKLCMGKSYEDVVKLEFKMACECTRQPDFYEGIRALLDEKTKDPKWASDSYDQDLTHYFENEFNWEEYLATSKESKESKESEQTVKSDKSEVTS